MKATTTTMTAMTPPSDINNSWERILEYSKLMNEFAAKEEWQQVATIAVERHQFVNLHFDLHPVGPNTAEYYFTRLKDFLRNEEKLQTLATNARKEVMRNGIKMSTGKKATQSYLNSEKFS